MSRSARVGHDVFISYAFADADAAGTICTALEARGIRCWIAPRDPIAGIPYAQQLVEAIAGARLVLFVLSPHANASAPVVNELEIAANRKRPIVPVRVADVLPAPGVEYYVRSVHWFDAMPLLEGRLDGLVRHVGAVLEHAAGDDAACPARATARPRGNLPYDADSFVGREREVDEILERLRGSRLVTLAGPGGIGKTRCALQVARRVVRHDGAWFVDLAPIGDPALVPSAILSALDVPQDDGTPPLSLLAAALVKRDLLLVLDNCEHVVAEAARAISALLTHAPNVTVLATSRETIHVAGEYVHQLRALDSESAAALFAERARAVASQFALRPENRHLVEDICRRLDGIPYAIELAAARIRTLTLEELSRRLELRLLSGGRDRQPRQQTMRSMIDWSYDMLGESEREAFRRCSVFAGGWNLDAAVAVCQDGGLDDLATVDALTSLVDKSLAASRPDGSAARFHLLEVVRQYAAGKLDAAGETDGARRRHAEAFARIAEDAYVEWDTGPRPDWRARLAKDLDNFRAALQWSIGEGRDPALGARLAGGIAVALLRLSLLREAVEWCERALPAQLDARIEARLQLSLSMLYNNQGAADRALQAARRAADLFRAAADDRGLTQALWQVAVKLEERGETGASRAVARDSIASARRLGEPRLLARALHHGASSAGDDLETARAMFRESVELFGSLGRGDETARALTWWAKYEAESGEFAAAIALCRRAEELADETLLPLVKIEMAGYSLARNDRAGAARTGKESLAAAVESDQPLIAALNFFYVGAAAVDSDPHAAAKLLGYAEAALEASDWKLTTYDAAIREAAWNALRAVLSSGELAELRHEGAGWEQHAAFAHATGIRVP